MTVSFYSGATLVNSQVIPMVVNCQWNWLGWDLSGLGVNRINIRTNHSSAGYIMMDDMEAHPGSKLPRGDDLLHREDQLRRLRPGHRSLLQDRPQGCASPRRLLSAAQREHDRVDVRQPDR